MNNDQGVASDAPNESPDEMSGSLDLNDLTSVILRQDESKEEQPEPEQPTGEEEPTEPEPAEELAAEEVEEGEPEPDAVEEPDEAEAEAATEPTDVLSKYNLDLDNIPEEDLKSLNKAMGGKAHKRINQLTAKNKQLQEELAQRESTQTQQPTNNNFNDILTLEQLDKEAENMTGLVDWVDDALDNEEKYDDDGNAYLAEANGRKYGKAELREIRKQATGFVKEIPKRRQFIDQKIQSEQLAEQRFDFITNAESDLYETFGKLLNDVTYKEAERILPNAKYLLAAALYGETAMMQAAGGAKAPAKQPAKAKPKAPAPAGAAQARTSSTKKKQQEVEARRKQLARDGGLDSLAKLLESNME